MLEPTKLPDEYRELEQELSRSPAEELSQELRTKIMDSVQASLDRESRLSMPLRPRTLQSWGRLSLASIAAAAAVTLIVTLLVAHRSTRGKLKQMVKVPSVSEDVTTLSSQQAPSLPTVQHYRLALSESPADWEASLHRETNRFEDLSGDAPTISWRQGTSSLIDDD